MSEYSDTPINKHMADGVAHGLKLRIKEVEQENIQLKADVSDYRAKYRKEIEVRIRLTKIVKEKEARIARLEDALGETVDLLEDARVGDYKIDSLSSQYAKTVLNEPDQQSLVEHDCEVIEKLIKKYMIVADGREVCMVSEMESYIDEIRNSVKEGE